MRKTSMVNVSLIVILLAMLVVIFSIMIARSNYIKDTTTIQEMLADRTIINYFSSEQITSQYEVDGVYQDVVLSPICIDCEQSISNMYNSQSMLIIDAPETICDTDVERCILYQFDPFGIELFSRQTILRNNK